MIRIWLVVLLLFPGAGAFAIAPGDAAPPVTRFAPGVDVYPQNFSVVVDAQDRVFLGNSEGVLIFDGEYWQLVPLANNDIVRWVESDGAGRIYAGGYDAFGYIEQQPTGEFVHTDLTARFADALGGKPFADIWQIVVDDAGVFFLALEHVFFFDPATGATQMWFHDGSMGPGVSFGGKVYVQFRGEGLKVFQDGDWTLIEDSPDLRRTLLASIVRLNDDSAVIISSDGPWYRFDGERFEAMPAAEAIPNKSSVTRAIALDESTIALATQIGEIVIYDVSRGTSEVVKASSGFLPALSTTSGGDLVGVDDLGFFTLPWPATWRRLGPEAGLAGGLHRVMVVDDNTYALSSSGAFRKQPGMPFERLDWTDNEAWDLLPLPNGEFLLAESYTIRHLRADGTIDIIDQSTTARLFHPSRYDPNVIYVGTEFGLQILQRRGDTWQSVIHADDMDNMRVSQIIERGPSELWVGSYRGGVRRLTIEKSPDWQVTDEHFGPALGIRYGEIDPSASLFEVNGDVIASTSEGLFQWDGERFVATSMNGLEQHRLPNRTFELMIDGDDAWAWDYGRVFHYDGGWQEQDLGTLKNGAIGLMERIDHCVVIGTMSTLLLNEQTPGQVSPAPAAPVRITSVNLLADDASPIRLPINDIRYPSTSSRVTLRYAMPDLINPGAVRYRTRLLPTETGFSPWTEDSQQSFVQLDPGEYELQIEAMNSQKQIASLTLPLVVEPQWYETMVARVLFFAAIGAALALLTMWLSRRRSQLLELERDRLEQIVAERTRELKSANQQLERMAHLDGLTQIPNRRRLDDYLEDVRQQCVERSRIMAIALIDVDHFKQYNDSFGHQAGDTLLINLARLLSRNLRRAEDLVARYGGEEFLVVLPGAGEITGRRVIEAMRESVARSDLGVTISAGLHVVTPDEDIAVEDMIAAADSAMYQAKAAGRNRVVSSSEAAPEDSGVPAT